MKEIFVGIDIGTTNVKAAAFDKQGDLLAYFSVPTPIVHPVPGFSEFPAERLWQGVCSCLRGIVEKVGDKGIVSVGVSAMAEGGLLLDDNGMPLSDIIAWYDMRSAEQCQQLERIFGKEHLYHLTGQTASAKYGITKLMWINRYKPELVQKAAHWLSVEDYALYRLSGAYVTDYSVASRTMAFDIHKLAWSNDILKAVGVNKALFPEPYPGGTRVGSVTAKAGIECGLPVGTAVCTGGHDHACAAISVDILQDGVCMDSMGTAEVSMMAMEKASLTPQALSMCYSVYPHCGRKLYRAITSNQSCGVCVDWALRTLGQGLQAEAERLSVSEYDLFLDKLTDGNGLFFLPFLRGTVEQSDVQGVFWGMSDRHTPKDMTSSIIDGLCFELKRQIEGYERVFGTKASLLRVVGGLSKSAPIMSRKSRIQRCKIDVPRITEAACYGAALLGGLGADTLSWNEQRFVDGTEYIVEPAAADQERYEKYLKLRRCALEMYERMKEA